MKTMCIEALAFMGGMALVGCWYMKMHPEKMKELKEIGKEISRTIYIKLDEEN